MKLSFVSHLKKNLKLIIYCFCESINCLHSMIQLPDENCDLIKQQFRCDIK